MDPRYKIKYLEKKYNAEQYKNINDQKSKNKN